MRKRLDTPAARAFWARAAEVAKEVGTWPAWKRGGMAPAFTESTDTIRLRYVTCRHCGHTKSSPMEEHIDLGEHHQKGHCGNFWALLRDDPQGKSGLKELLEKI